MGINSGNSTRVMTEDNIQGLDGYIGITANDNVRTLGLQNFYGHIWDFLHNVIVRSASKVWVKKDFVNADIWPTYSNAVSSGWEELDMALPSTAISTCISILAYNSTEPWALYPSKYGGNNVEPIGDGCWNSTNDPFSVVIISGGAYDGASDGSLCWHSRHPFSLSDANIGGRGLEIAS